MKLVKVLLTSLVLQLTLYVYTIHSIYAERGNDWDLLNAYPLFIFAFLGIVNIGLFISYFVQKRRLKQPINIWLVILMVIMLFMTLSIPWVVNGAQGPQPVDAYADIPSDTGDSGGIYSPWFLVEIIAGVAGIIVAASFVFYMIARILSRYSNKLPPADRKKSLVIVIITSLVSLTLLASTLLVGPSFFNNPQYTDSGIETTTTWPYNVERITLPISILISLYFWVRYLRQSKQ